MAAKVLGIYGSPRRGGNSDLLLDRALEGAASAGAEVKKIYARKLKMSGCLECGGCDQTGQCVVDDQMQDVYPLLDWAEVIILAGPVFFYSLPAQVKALIDRGQAMWSRRKLTKTREERRTYDSGRGFLIGVGATRGQNLFQGVDLTARYFFDALDMDYGGGLFFRQIEAKGAVAEHPQALDQAFEFGRRAAGGSTQSAPDQRS
ncbi:MAG: flavodoxin family protein [Deltaproteobacteria bacterium]|nr:flavodoxin family protein [Deltaproteobacteria bacterium]